MRQFHGSTNFLEFEEKRIRNKLFNEVECEIFEATLISALDAKHAYTHAPEQ